MTSRSDETKQRLLLAATAEFAQHGLAGARTKRIADAADANEALLHRYFGGKQQLFGQAFEALVAETLDTVPLTPEDLPGYAGRLFDFYRVHPAVVRLHAWSALEQPSGTVGTAAMDAFHRKEEQIAAAQEAGLVSNEIPAGELLSLVVHLSLSGSQTSSTTEPPVDPELRRRSVVAAVTALVGAERHPRS